MSGKFSRIKRLIRDNKKKREEEQAAAQAAAQAKAERGEVLGNSGSSSQSGLSTQNKPSLLSIRKKKEQALIEDASNQNSVVEFSQGKIILG